MDPVKQLIEMGFEVRAFTNYHFRVNGEIDFWLPRGRWHDLETGERGQKPLDQLSIFIHRRLSERVKGE